MTTIEIAGHHRKTMAIRLIKAQMEQDIIDWPLSERGKQTTSYYNYTAPAVLDKDPEVMRKMSIAADRTYSG